MKKDKSNRLGGVYFEFIVQNKNKNKKTNHNTNEADDGSFIYLVNEHSNQLVDELGKKLFMLREG